jgi:preprotein translocase subunit SecG
MWYHLLCNYGLMEGRLLFNNERIGFQMSDTLNLVLTIVQLLTCLFLIAVVLLQSGKRSGLSGAIAGGADTFMSKQKATTLDGKLAKMTKWVGIAFVVLTLVLNLA